MEKRKICAKNMNLTILPKLLKALIFRNDMENSKYIFLEHICTLIFSRITSLAKIIRTLKSLKSIIFRTNISLVFLRITYTPGRNYKDIEKFKEKKHLKRIYFRRDI